MVLHGDVDTQHGVSSRRKPCSFGAVDPPICEECQELDLSFFDPTCIGCQDILSNPRTTISEIFAIIRQWVPQTQQNIDSLIDEIVKRGAHIDDRDGLTDMTLLHYAAKSGANGVGDIDTSCRVVAKLIDRGANLNVKCRWTDMSALHYAVFFDINAVVKILLEASNVHDIDQCSKEFDNGTALHIGCANQCYDSVETLILNGANPHYVNKFGKPPISCIPTVENTDLDDKATEMCDSLRKLLSVAMQNTQPNKTHNLSLSTLQALGLELHDQVIVAGKVGILRFCGSTDFASGQWAGIELNQPLGKNDGSITGVRYFECKPKHGIFAPLTRVNKYDGILSIPLTVDGLRHSSSSSPASSNKSSLLVGDKVIVAGQKLGIVQYIGPTKFASGTWVGIALEQAAGKNDGMLAGIRYFSCNPKHGVFAPLNKVKRICDVDEPRDHFPSNVDDMDILLESHAPLNLPADSVSNKLSPTNEMTVVKSSKETTKSPHENINRNISTATKSSLQKKSNSLDTTLGVRINFTLKDGMSVYANNELGIVRFIGRVEFADGIWLGVELRKPNGKNDGTVENKRYFTCKPKHGLMVRPSRATCRGINCAQLVDMKFR